MSDYQLERLNARSFEQLVQALSLAEFGPKTTVFGDGPDGGREATFDGPIEASQGKLRWNGYGIIQAKFRQVPERDHQRNATWLLRQIDGEFKKLRPRRTRVQSPRTCPKYYVIATNVILSPVSGGGGKDRVAALLEGYKKSHGLVDFLIWDSDQIQRMLDVHADIRTTYAAWLMPGDVLGAMLKHLQLDQVQFGSTIEKFLESELLDDQFAKLGQGGYTDAKNIPLSSVFVDLPVNLEDANAIGTGPLALRRTSSEPAVPTLLKVLLEEGRQVLRPSAMPRRQQLIETSTAGRLVLVGGPGQGKTTVGQFACQLLRASLLQHSTRARSAEVSQALQRIGQMSAEVPAVKVRRYPLRVDLKQLASSLAGEKDRCESLLDFLLQRIASRTNTKVREAEFRGWLGSYPWLLVLDGLDEVPASSNRSQVMQAIRDFISVEAHSLDADLLVLATTRPQGYSDEFDNSLYRHLVLRPLMPPEALEYGKRLAQARHPGQLTRVEELTSSLERATKNPATARLMQSPLQVTIMLALIEGGGEPPEQRWKLFHDYYDVIYRREKERGTAFSSLLGRYEPDIHWIHHRAGWVLQRLNAGSGSTHTRLSHIEFENLVDERLQHSGHLNSKDRRALVEQLRKAATDRLVFLVGNTENEIGFEIRSLQEFMAAEHFFDGGEACVRASLPEIAAYPYWRNVFLFAAGRIFFERQEMVDGILSICNRLNDHPSDNALRAVCAGSRLAVSMLRDGAARNQPAATRLLARTSVLALDSVDDEVLHEISEVCVSDVEEVWKGEILRRLSATSPLPIYVWHLCFLLADEGRGWALTALDRFPWRTEVARALLRSSREYGLVLPKTFWNQLRAHFYSQSPTLLNMFIANEEWRDGCPPELRPLIATSRPDTPVAYPDGQISPLSIDLRGSTARRVWRTLDWSSLQAQSEVHPGWFAFKAISNFCRLRSEQSLVDAVRECATVWPDVPEDCATWRFPWQIGVCFEARKDGIPWHQILRGIAARSLGNRREWAAVEKVGRHAIQFEHFAFTSDGSIQPHRLGSLLYAPSWSIVIDQSQATRFVAEIVDAYRCVPELRPNWQLVTLAAILLEGANESLSTWNPAVVESLLRACEEYALPVSDRLVTAIVAGPTDVGVTCSHLAIAGRCKLRFDGGRRNWREGQDTRANAAVAEIVAGLQSRSDWRSIVVALSYVRPVPALAEVPRSMLDALHRGSSRVEQRASALLRLMSLEEGDVFFESWLGLLTSEHGLEPTPLDSFFDFVESKGLRGRRLEEAFLAALKLGSDCSETLQGRIATILVKLTERRPPLPELPDPRVATAPRVAASD